MVLASFPKSDDEPNRESLFLVLHQSCSGGFRCIRHGRHGTCFKTAWSVGTSGIPVKVLVARGQHDAWVEEVEAIF